MATRTRKMETILRFKIRVTIQDRRDIVGQFLSFDRHMNLIIADAEEFRRVGGKSVGGPGQKRKQEKILKRPLGLVLLRGENIVSFSIEGPPPPEENRNRAAPVLAATGPGLGKPAGRGIAMAPGLAPVLPPGLAGPVKGLGGPAPSFMQPTPPGMPKYPGAGMPKFPPSGFPPYGAPGMPPGMPFPGGAPPGMPPKFPPGMYGAPGMPPYGMPPGMPKYGGPPHHP